MKKPTRFIEAIGPGRIVSIIQGLLKVREELDLSSQQVLDDSVREFFLMNPMAVATIALGTDLPQTEAREIEELLKRAHARAVGHSARVRIEEIAITAGFLDLFDSAKSNESTFLTPSQKAGMELMLGLARLHFGGGKRCGIELRTRLSPVSKTSVVIAPMRSDYPIQTRPTTRSPVCRLHSS